MKIVLETERLILREFLPEDVADFYEMDSNREVHRFLGNNPITTLDQALENINSIRRQYEENGIGRWAVIEKETGSFVGWSGLKFIREYENNRIHFYDVGYRLNPKFWGKGYATESAMAAIEYGFTKMNLTEIIGIADVDNIRSRRALEKCGLRFVEKFEFDLWKTQCDWLSISKEEWIEQKSVKIIKTKKLTNQQSSQINQLWNDEYPAKLKDRFPILLEGVENYNHYVLEDSNKNVIAWAVDFEKEKQIRFSIIVSANHKGKGIGGLLMDKLKSENDVFFGWVIDHNDDLKINGDHYRTPMPFYLKKGFEILEDVRIDNEMIKAVLIKWSKK